MKDRHRKKFSQLFRPRLQNIEYHHYLTVTGPRVVSAAVVDDGVVVTGVDATAVVTGADLG